MSNEYDIRQSYISAYSDAFKDMNGVRPRHIDFDTIPLEELAQMVDDIYEQYKSFDFEEFYGPDYGKPYEPPPPSEEELFAQQQAKSDAELGVDSEFDLMPKHQGMGRVKEEMKITESELKALIGEAVKKRLASLKEAPESGTSVPNGESVASFIMEFNSHINKMIEDTKKLADKGEALIETNLLNHPEVGTRNELLIQHVGMLRSVANSLATIFERIRRFAS